MEDKLPIRLMELMHTSMHVLHSPKINFAEKDVAVLHLHNCVLGKLVGRRMSGLAVARDTIWVSMTCDSQNVV